MGFEPRCSLVAVAAAASGVDHARGVNHARLDRAAVRMVELSVVLKHFRYHAGGADGACAQHVRRGSRAHRVLFRHVEAATEAQPVCTDLDRIETLRPLPLAADVDLSVL